MHKGMGFFNLFGVLIYGSVTFAQTNQVFGFLFKRILIDDTRLSGTHVHAFHFIPAADIASERLTPALNRLIANNIASFPLSSTAVGVTFDWASGVPMSILQSLGPIYGEKAQTLGKGKLNLDFNYTYLNLSKFRGLATRDIRFTFTHEDVEQPGLGDSPNESDLIDMVLGLDLNANIFAFLATLGITNNLDVGLAIPFTRISLGGEAMAIIDSYTFASTGNANVRFNDDPLNPKLDDHIPYESIPTETSAIGLGNLAFRLKYSFLQGPDIDLAALLDIRFPTGDENNFFGTGKTNIKLLGIMSKTIGNFSPHLNIGYDHRSADFDSDEFELIVGFDQKLASGLTFAAEFLSEFDLYKDEAIVFFPEGTVVIHQQIPNQVTGEIARYDKVVDLTNIPERNNDNMLNLAVGFRVAPSRSFLFLGNILVPLNDGGLRSSIAPTIGLTIAF